MAHVIQVLPDVSVGGVHVGEHHLLSEQVRAGPS